MSLAKICLDVISRENCIKRLKEGGAFKKDNPVGQLTHLYSETFCTWTSKQDYCNGKYQRKLFLPTNNQN